jgi:hypothetical protein
LTLREPYRLTLICLPIRLRVRRMSWLLTGCCTSLTGLLFRLTVRVFRFRVLRESKESRVSRGLRVLTARTVLLARLRCLLTPVTRLSLALMV